MLGTVVTEWLLQQRVRRLCLASRSGLLASDSQAVLLAPHYSASITLAKCDAGAQADVAAMAAGPGTPGIAGLMHAGGVLADATVANQTLEGVRAVFAPKAAAWQHMDVQLSLQPMHGNVLFSSAAALLGSVGQANYSIANSWLDAMASTRQVAGASVLSVQFGAWKGVGMAAATSGKLEAMGLGALTAASALSALHGLLRSAGAPLAASAGLLAQMAMIPFDWPAFLQGLAQPLPYFANFAHLKAAAETAGTAAAQAAPQHAAGGTGASAAASAAAGMTPEQRLPYLLAEVESAAAAIVGRSVGTSEPLMAAGLDSLGAVELRNSLEGRLGLELPSTLVFDYPTISAIAGYVTAALADAEPDAVQAAMLVVSAASGGAAAPLPAELMRTSSTQLAALAVTGMATRGPAGALEESLLVDVIGAIPVSRWDAELQLTQDLPARFGGFLGGAFMFDPGAFGITSTEAILMDPQQRLLLECTEETLRGAQVAASVLEAPVGVFVGISSPDFADLAKTHSEISAYSATGDAKGQRGLRSSGALPGWACNQRGW